MFCSSLNTSSQGQACVEAEKAWGMTCMSVCKAKYHPFRTIRRDGGPALKEELYGCSSHSRIRLKRIKEHGARPGWVDFAIWHGETGRKAKKRI